MAAAIAVVSLIAVLVAVLAGFLLSFGSTSGAGVFLALVFVVVPAAVVLALLPGSVLALRLVGRKSAAQPSLGAAVVLASLLLVWLGSSLAAAVAIDATGRWTPPAATAALPVVLVGGPAVAAAGVWWYQNRRAPILVAAIAALWLGATLTAVAPAVLQAVDPYRNLTLATIDQAELDGRGWRVVGVIDRAPRSVDIRIDAERGLRPGPELLTIRIAAAAPPRPCSGLQPCEPVGATADGLAAVWYEQCGAGETVARPELLVAAPAGVWELRQSGSISCGDDHAGLTVEELLAVADALESASPDDFWTWAAAVEQG